MFVTLDLSSLASGIRPKDVIDANDNSTPEPRTVLHDHSEAFVSHDELSRVSSIRDVGEQVQILGLSSSNPIVSYRKQLYSCHWTAPLGTDILLKPTSMTEGTHFTNLTESESPVLATSKLRLSAQPVRPNTLFKDGNDEEQDHPSPSKVSTPRGNPDHFDQELRLPPLETAPGISGSNGTFIQGTFVSISDSSTPKRKNQARFLSRLEAAKRSRGEIDNIVVHRQKPLSGAGWRSQRKELENESDLDVNDDDECDDEGSGPGEANKDSAVTDSSISCASKSNPSPARPLINDPPRPGYSIYGRKIGRPRSLKKLVDEIERQGRTEAMGLSRKGRPRVGKRRTPGRGPRARRSGPGSQVLGVDEEDDMMDDVEQGQDEITFNEGNSGHSAAQGPTGVDQD